LHKRIAQLDVLFFFNKGGFMRTQRRVVGYIARAVLCGSICINLNGTAQESESADGIIVRYRTAQQAAALSARILTIQDVASRRGLSATYARSGALGIHVMKLDRTLPVAEAELLAAQIEATDPNVEYAEPDRRMYAAFVPNDTRYNEQWHYFETTAGSALPAAWDLSTGSGVNVAVIDTGYRPHADLAANVLSGYDFISNTGVANDGDGRDGDAQDPGDACASDPSSWHGTHVAGTVAAVTNNGSGVAGVAFNAKIVPARVLGVCGGDESDIADAIVWASGGSVPGVPANANPARVLSLSLRGPGACSSTYQNAINTARSNNSVVVVAAGNDSADAANFAPANCPGVITVAAVNRSGSKASYSNFGSTVEIAGPGGETFPTLGNGVLSTLNTGTAGPGADDYAFYQGTSMATPHVSGVAALMLAANGALTPDQVSQHIQSTARAFPGTCSQCGSGIVDAYAAVVAASSVVDNATLTVGAQSLGPASRKGYLQSTAMGAISPAVLSTGQQVIQVTDTYLPNTVLFNVAVSGFSSDPGASWLVKVSVNGVTPNFTGAYSYSGGIASWQWPTVSAFTGIPVGGTAALVLTHR
jgi:serine protease